MSDNRKSSREAKAATIAMRRERGRKVLECSMPKHSEFVLNMIANHKRNYGWN